jgi:hypothetical protein
MNLCRPRAHIHEGRDVAVLHPIDHENVLAALAALGRRTIQLADKAPEEGDPLHFFGNFFSQTQYLRYVHMMYVNVSLPTYAHVERTQNSETNKNQSIERSKKPPCSCTTQNHMHTTSTHTRA